MTPEQREAVRALRWPGLIILALSLFVWLVDWRHARIPSIELAKLGDQVNVDSGYLAAVLCYCMLPARRLERWLLLGPSVAVETVLWIHRPTDWNLEHHVKCIGWGVGVFALVGLAWRLVTARGDERRWSAALLTLAGVGFFFPGVSKYFHERVVEYTKYTYDGHAYTIDGTFGFEPAPALTRIIKAHWWLDFPTYYLYQELSLVMAAVVLVGLRYPQRCYPNIMLTLILMGLGAYLSYLVTPMVGVNLWVGDKWPNGPLPAPGDLKPWAEPDGWWRNCFPSLHMGWTLALFYSIRRVSPWVKGIMLGALGVMAMAIINPGCHYCIDPVGSFPYVACFLALTATRAPRVLRVGVFAAGFSLFSLVTYYVRWAPLTLFHHPTYLAIMALSVIATSIFLESR
ncbi:MAG TPA: phosphatase PAP2 family protein, partial [Candidatus Xenobia bacterium]